jgi:type IV pilus assembly protein PilQ
MTRKILFALGAASLLAVPALQAADVPPAAQVTAVSIVPTPGHAEIVIALDGAAEVRDFVLRGPDRLVIDVVGATLRRSGAAYDGIQRGGIKDIRYSQFRPDVVRIAIYLDGAKDYRLEKGADAVRVQFGADQGFLAWSSAAPADLEPPTDRGTLVQRAPEVTPPAEAAPAASTTLPPAPRITVTWDKASIGDVCAGFAAFSGKTIVLGKDIKGEVTAEIKNQPWTEAFAAVLATQGLQAIELPGGIIRVDSPAALAALDSTEPLTTRMLPVNYASAGQLLPSVRSILTKRGAAVSDTTTNSLIVTEVRSRIADVQEFVKGLDFRTPQVSIQAKIIFVDRTNIEDLGLKYDFGAVKQGDGPFFNKLLQRTDPATGDPFGTGVIDLTGDGVAGIANADATITGAALNLVWTTTLGGFRFSSFLSALQSVDLADVQAEPSITTLDNRQANIVVGEEVPVRVIDFGSATGGQGQQPKATISFRETGIKLNVTPHVTNNRQILMQVSAERSNVRLLSQLDAGFSIQKQAAQNQLLVNDGETAVIGGLTVTTITKNRSGIPLLVDLPIIGKLFGFSHTQEQRQDLIILITPRIIDEGSE